MKVQILDFLAFNPAIKNHSHSSRSADQINNWALIISAKIYKNTSPSFS